MIARLTREAEAGLGGNCLTRHGLPPLFALELIANLEQSGYPCEPSP